MAIAKSISQGSCQDKFTLEMVKDSDVINGSKINMRGLKVTLQSECLWAFFFRMVHAGDKGFYNMAVSKEEGVSLSCFCSLAFTISSAVFMW